MFSDYKTANYKQGKKHPVFILQIPAYQHGRISSFVGLMDQGKEEKW
jgi:hypothetical protein